MLVCAVDGETLTAGETAAVARVSDLLKRVEPDVENLCRIDHSLRPFGEQGPARCERGTACTALDDGKAHQAFDAADAGADRRLAHPVRPAGRAEAAFAGHREQQLQRVEVGDVRRQHALTVPRLA